MVSCCSVVCFMVACFGTNQQSTAEKVIARYRADIEETGRQADKLIQLIRTDVPAQQIEEQFKKARTAYKQIEWLAEYYNPYTARYINGPALQEIEPDEKNIIIQPEGFQVIEEFIFPSYDRRQSRELLQQAKILHSNINRLAHVAALLKTTDAHIFDALRLEIFRIISLGISGYDSPVANNSIPEASASLAAVQRYYSLYRDDLQKENAALARRIDSQFQKALTYLSSNPDFVSFDRMAFIVNHLNPVSESLLVVQRQLNIPVFNEVRAIKADVASLFAKNIFNPDFYTSGTEMYSSDVKVALGKKLFYDPILSGDRQISCATCHQPEKAFTDGSAKAIPVGTHPAGTHMKRRNVPTLINAALQPALFYDLRVNYLEDQAKEVINNKDEMHGSFEKAIAHVRNEKQYSRIFEQVYQTPFSEVQLKNAIASYVRSLIAMNSRFDQYMRGDSSTMNNEEVDGFNVFMGKAKCGTCHFAPLFNGSNPPVFNKIDAEVIGVPLTPDTINAKLDDDEGRYRVFKADLFNHQFKTPTVRNIELTAPYMHNGVYKTLEEVVDFYNRGGGAGLGLQISNQTLPEDRLNLTVYEKKALVSFMKTLTDSSYMR